MNNQERDAAIDDLIRRVEALEGHVHGADELHEFTDPPILPAEEPDVRNEENSQPGQQG